MLDVGLVLVGLVHRGGAAFDVGRVFVGLVSRGGAAFDVGLVLVALDAGPSSSASCSTRASCFMSSFSPARVVDVAEEFYDFMSLFD